MDRFQSCSKHFVLITGLARGQPVSCTSCDPFLSTRSRKRDLAETILVVIMSSCLRRQKRSKTEILCSFVVSCIVSIVSRHERFPQKEHSKKPTRQRSDAVAWRSRGS